MTAKREGQQPAAQLPAGYTELPESLKARIRQAPVRAALSVNREPAMPYRHIGQETFQRQQQEGWRAKAFNCPASNLRRAFRERKGFSPRNLTYMQAFAEASSNEQTMREAPAQSDLLLYPNDRPAIEHTLCKGPNRPATEYALRDLGKPMGVGTRPLTETSPVDPKNNLPTIEERKKEPGYGR